ncbi:MAG: sigma-54 dependent transcriptional regulator [Rikenellaceae bacterium]|nr:sigma-54 dependent transcriptional regulator [Rikenellaceae bacterium]
MAKQGNLLIVDDNKSILTALKLLLSSHYETVTTLNTPNNLISSMREGQYDVVLLDMNFSAGINSGNEGLFWLSEIKKYYPETQVVMFTAYADIDLAVKALKNGAADFMVKPWDNARLISTLNSAYNLSRSKKEIKHLKEINRELVTKPSMFWGNSTEMRQLRNLVEKVAVTDANVLITGENGTGKELLAREMHFLSLRRDRPMVSVDLGSITETLFESELFGHIKGAFTDARNDRAGKFEAASGGTLFLDEVGNLPYHLQAKLLTALQGRRIVRVGSNISIPVDIRLITATNCNLQEMVSAGTFREDLLYRINTIHLHIPPLRERAVDIIGLAGIFLEKYSEKYGKPIRGISKNAETKLCSYPWYGNIRELEHSIEKAVILCDTDTLDSRDFLLSSQQNTSGVMNASTLEEMEREMIRINLIKFGDNMSAVANQLGITRQTLYNKIKKYNL